MKRITHIDESIPGRWALAGNALLLAIGLNRAEAFCTNRLLIRHRTEIGGELGNQITSQRPVVVVVVGAGAGASAGCRRRRNLSDCCWGGCCCRGCFPRGRSIRSLVNSQ